MPAPPPGIFRHPLSWRSRLFRGVVAGFVLILMVRGIWGWHAGRGLSARLDELRRQGQPIEVADVAEDPIPDAKNAWHFQNLAAQARSATADSPANSNLEYDDFPPYPKAWWQLAEASEKANNQLFFHARRARQHDRVQFRTGLTSPVATILLPYLNQCRALANTLGDGALYAHLKGDDVEALQRLRDLLHLGRSLRHDDVLISQLVGNGIEALTFHRTQVIAPGLTITPATRPHVEQLIRDLLDERVHRRGVTRGLAFERLATLDTLRTTSDATWLIRPLAHRQAIRDLDNLQLAIDASHADTQPEADAILGRRAKDPDERSPLLTATFAGTSPPTLPRYSRWFNGGYAGSNSRYLTTAYRVLADRRGTAVSLAAQLYRADHAGAWPARLDDLVPAYLPSVPTSPFHADHHPLGYLVEKLPDGTPRPLLFVGPEDDPQRRITPTPMYGWQGHGDLGEYRDLSRFAPPKPPPATSPVTVEKY